MKIYRIASQKKISRVDVLKNVRCEECGGLMKTYYQGKSSEPILCKHCKNPIAPSVGTGGTGQYHAEDDQSGASSSWDNAVKSYESSIS